MIKPLSRMGGHHFLWSKLDSGSVFCVLGQVIEVGKMSAGPVKKETGYLSEEVEDWVSFGIIEHGAKEPAKTRVNADFTEVTNKEMSSNSPSQTIGCDCNDIDAMGTLGFGSGHGQLHQFDDDNCATATELFVIYFGKLEIISLHSEA